MYQSKASLVGNHFFYSRDLRMFDSEVILKGDIRC